MNQHLSRLISDYQAGVRTAVSLLQASGIPLPATNTDWAGTDIPQRGELSGGIAYFKHGYGCSVKLPGGGVDFDFGEHGEIDGFDAWRLAGFAGSRLPEYGFADEAALNEFFNQEVAAGLLVYSGYILHYIAEKAMATVGSSCCNSRRSVQPCSRRSRVFWGQARMVSLAIS